MQEHEAQVDMYICAWMYSVCLYPRTTLIDDAISIAAPFVPQVTNLKPDTSYVFLVRARNSQGLSVPGPFSDVARTTNIDQHAIPQTELIRARDRLNSEILYLKDVQPLSSTSVKIVWDVSNRGAIEETTRCKNINPSIESNYIIVTNYLPFRVFPCLVFLVLFLSLDTGSCRFGRRLVYKISSSFREARISNGHGTECRSNQLRFDQFKQVHALRVLPSSFFQDYRRETEQREISDHAGRRTFRGTRKCSCRHDKCDLGVRPLVSTAENYTKWTINRI